MRKLYKSKKREDIDMVNAAIQNILSLLPKHLTAELQLARRTTMQVSGATPKCKPIEPSLKKRTTPKAEKREGRCLEVGKDAGGNAENVLSTMHTQVKSSVTKRQLKRRTTLNLERRTKKRFLETEEDLELKTREILSTSHALLQSCFLCGKRVPSDSDEGDIEWLSCTNMDSCLGSPSVLFPRWSPLLHM